MRAVIFLALVAFAACSIQDNEIETQRVFNGDELIDEVSKCFEDESPIGCLKVKVLSFLDAQLGVKGESRALSEDDVDEEIFQRLGRMVSERTFQFTLPEFLFQKAVVSYSAEKGLDVNFPETDAGSNEARGLLKKKLLLPVLLLLKLKLKALMPLVVALVGLKALKALVLSKIAIGLVLGFLIYNLVMKKGAMPMQMMPTEAPAPQYGPPASTYGPPVSSPAPPSDSYSPHWDPSSSGPYARVWDPSQLAYSSYYPSEPSQSSSYSSVSSVSSSPISS